MKSYIQGKAEKFLAQPQRPSKLKFWCFVVWSDFGKWVKMRTLQHPLIHMIHRYYILITHTHVHTHIYAIIHLLIYITYKYVCAQM